MKIIPISPSPITIGDFVALRRQSATAEGDVGYHPLPDGLVGVSFRDDVHGIVPSHFWALTRGREVLAFGWIAEIHLKTELDRMRRVVLNLRASALAYQPT